MSELIRFECPQCRKSLSARPQHAGRSTKCPGCECLVKVPSPEVQTEDFFDLLEAAEPMAKLPERNPRNELYQQLSQAADSGATDQALAIIAQLKVEAASDEFSDLWTLERELKRAAVGSSSSNVGETNTSSVRREMGFSPPPPTFELPPDPVVPNPASQMDDDAMSRQTPLPTPPSALPPTRPPRAVPMQHLAIPGNDTPDGFRWQNDKAGSSRQSTASTPLEGLYQRAAEGSVKDSTGRVFKSYVTVRYLRWVWNGSKFAIGISWLIGMFVIAFSSIELIADNAVKGCALLVIGVVLWSAFCLLQLLMARISLETVAVFFDIAHDIRRLADSNVKFERTSIVT